MKKILIPTKNPHKFNRYKKLMERYPNVQIVSLNDISIPDVTYPKGDNIEEDTKNRAQAYADATNIPTLIMDIALYFDDTDALTNGKQPELNIASIAKENATDEEILQAYIDVIKKIPENQRTCRWFHTFCFAIPQEGAMCDTAELQEMFTDTPKLPIIPGYPLKSLLFDPLTQKTHAEYTEEEDSARNKPVYDKLFSIIDDLIKE